MPRRIDSAALNEATEAYNAILRANLDNGDGAETELGFVAGEPNGWLVPSCVSLIREGRDRGLGPDELMSTAMRMGLAIGVLLGRAERGDA
jgi:hypothetical protein